MPKVDCRPLVVKRRNKREEEEKEKKRGEEKKERRGKEKTQKIKGCTLAHLGYPTAFYSNI
jgi:hypothetical protein